MVFSFLKKKSNKIKFYAPCSGELVTMSEVNDEVFKQKMMGDGFGVIPSVDKICDIYSPLEGSIISVFDTQHAIGIDNNGLHVLVHIGIDTVELKGSGFETIIENEENVDRETLISKVDLTVIKNHGLEDTVIVALTNEKNVVKEFKLLKTGVVEQGELVAECTLK